MLLKGLVIGLTIAAPVGPIGVLCIRRTLEQGKLIGFISGLGAATADGIYGLCAGLGLTFMTNFLIGWQWWLQLIGGVFLIYLGVSLFFLRSSRISPKTKGTRSLAAYSSTFFLTLTNPVTILAFVAIFSNLGIIETDSTIMSLMLVLGVFLGSIVWWLFLCSIAGLVANRVNGFSFIWINRISGSILLLFGLLSLYRLI